MAVTAKEFNVNTPADGDPAIDGDDQFRDDKTALDERYALEHQSLQAAAGVDLDTATAPGRHIPGKVSVCEIDTLTNIQALTGMVTGAMAYDITNDRLLIYNGADWTTYPIVSGVGDMANALAFRAYKAAAQSVSASSWTKLRFDTEDYDSGSKYDHVTNYRYTPVTLGIYHLSACGVFPMSYTQRGGVIAIYKNGSVYAIGSQGTWGYDAASSTRINSVVSTDVEVDNAADYFEVYARHYSTSSVSMTGGSWAMYFTGRLVATS